jgi:ABC-type sugar transport system, periplasmic component
MKKSLGIIISIILILAFVFPASAFSSIAVKSIKLDKNKITLNIGQTYKLKVTLTPANTTQKKLTFVTDNVKVATIDSNGLIKGVGKGSTTITVLTVNKKISAKCTVNVVLPEPQVLEITRANYFGDVTEYPELKEEYMKEFEKKFNIKLKVNPLPASGYMDKVNLMVSAGEINGLLNLETPADVLRYKSDGVIEPLDEYLKGNAVWEGMSKGYKTLFKYDNQIWGFGSGFTGGVFARSFRQDWLDKLQMKVPTNVDEFALIMKAFTENDPDGNGKNDTYGMTGASTGWNLQDIFQAFDARLDNTGGSSIAWDPNVNSWVDSMLKPEMIDALKYVNKLYTSKYIDPEIFTNKSAVMREKMTTGKAGSLFYWQMWAKNNEVNLKKTVPNASVTEILGLKGKRIMNINHMPTTGTPYVMIKGTSKAKEMVQTYFNTFLGNKDAYIMGRFGIEGKTYKVVGKEIVVLLDPATKSPMKDPRMVGQIDPTYDFNNMPWVYEGTQEEMAASRAANVQKQKQIDQALLTGLLFKCPYDSCISETRSNVTKDADKIFQEAFVKAITGEVPAEDAVKKYRQEMKAIGGDKILQEANKANGLKNKMTY